MLGPVLLSKDLEAIELLKDADIGPLVPVSSCFYWIFWICSFQFAKTGHQPIPHPSATTSG